MLKIWAPLGLFHRWKSGFREVKSMLFEVTQLVRWCQDSNLTWSPSKPALFPLDPQSVAETAAWVSPGAGSKCRTPSPALTPERTRICTLTSPPAVLCTGQVREARSETTLLWKCGTVSFFSSGVTRDPLGSVKLRVSFVSELELQHSALPAPFPAASEWRQWTKA